MLRRIVSPAVTVKWYETGDDAPVVCVRFEVPGAMAGPVEVVLTEAEADVLAEKIRNALGVDA
jgi:hypothetical protein